MQAKVLIQGTFHTISLPSSLSLFKAKIEQEFKGLELYRIQYKDLDDDLITVSTEDDYKIALEDLKEPTLYFAIVDLTNSVGKLHFTSVKSTYIPEESESIKEPTHEAKPIVTKGKENLKEDDAEEYNAEEHNKGLGEGGKKRFSCKGQGVNDKLEQCKAYKGTGVETELISTLKEHIKETLKEDLTKIVQEEVQKSIISQSNILNSLVTNLSRSSIIQHFITCSICREEIKAGESVYHCLLCKGFYSCESCEENNNHQHSLAKGKKAGEKIDYQMKIINSSYAKDKIEAGEIYSRVWTLKNIGKRQWPENVELKLIEGDNLRVEVSEVESAFPGAQCDVLIKLKAPTVGRKYRQVFQLESKGVKFGEKINFEFDVIYKEYIDPREENKGMSVGERIERIRRLSIFETKYEDNLRTLLENQEQLDELHVLRLLRDHNNDLPEVIALIDTENRRNLL